MALPYLWLVAFVVLPFLLALRLSFLSYADAAPPYGPTLDLSDGLGGILDHLQAWTWGNYAFLFEDPFYGEAYLSSLLIAAVSTLLVVLIGYPVAYGVARSPLPWRRTLVMLIVLPFWTSFLIRVYAWIGILKPEGLLNGALMGLGLIDEPLQLYPSTFAVYLAIVYSYLPFFVLPLYATLEKQDPSLVEAAVDLGCSRTEAFWRVTFPISRPGLIAGSLLVFIPAMGEVVIPDLMGDAGTLMIGKALWDEFFINRDWPLAAAISVVLLLALVVPLMIYQRAQAQAAGIEP